MLEKLVDILMMDSTDHSQTVSDLKKHAEEETNTLTKWVYDTYDEIKEADRISDMILGAMVAQQRYMLAKGIVIGLRLGIDCLTDEVKSDSLDKSPTPS